MQENISQLPKVKLLSARFRYPICLPIQKFITQKRMEVTARSIAITVILDGDMYTCAENDSLERLLKNNRYLGKKSLQVDQIIVLFRLLKEPMKDIELLRSTDLMPGGSQERYAGNIAAPSMQESNDGAEMGFLDS